MTAARRDGTGRGNFLVFLVRHRGLVAELARKEIRGKYLGSFLGLFWAFVQPLATILIFAFLFAIGLRTGPSGQSGTHLPWLVAGMIPWFFLNDGVVNGAGAILDNAFLLRKVSFRIGLLPLVRVAAALFNAGVLGAIAVAVLLAAGRGLSLHALQAFYYLGAAATLVTGLTLILAPLAVFAKDIRHVVTIGMQFAFWLTGVFWSVTLLPEKFRVIVRANPFSYVVEGFRDALVERRWVWDARPGQTLYFWAVTAVVLAAGIAVFRKLRPNLADHA